MKYSLWLLALSILGTGSAWPKDPPVRQESAPPKSAVEREPLTAEAESIVKELRDSLPKDSEALAMLENILTGSTLGPEDGWFPLAKPQTRFDWEKVRQRFDTDQDGQVNLAEFGASPNDFGRMDRDNDGALDASDFDWSKHSLTPTPGFNLFFMADRDGNGKLTQTEFAELFRSLSSEPSEFLALDDLRHQFEPSARPSTPAIRPDRPSRSTLIVGLKNQEIGSLQSGPQLEEQAPDFTLKSLDGVEVTLSKVIGPKPLC